MPTNQTTSQGIDEYIAAFPPNVQALLQQIRMTITTAAPEALETISYQMPSFTLNGHYLVYFGAYKRHIGFYPAPIGIAEFADDLARYESGKGTLKFPLDQPMPLDLISRMVKFRAAENLKQAAAKTAKRNP